MRVGSDAAWSGGGINLAHWAGQAAPARPDHYRLAAAAVAEAGSAFVLTDGDLLGVLLAAPARG